MGDYIDGVNDVAAGVDKFRFSLTLKSEPRRFFLDFSDNCAPGPGTCAVKPVLGGVSAGLTSGEGSENVFSTGHFDDSGFSLLDMGVTVPNSLPRSLQINFRDDNDDHWALNFIPDLCNSELVDVTRTSDTTWDFISDNRIACLERGLGRTTSHERYTVPFKFTVTLLP